MDFTFLRASLCLCSTCAKASGLGLGLKLKECWPKRKEENKTNHLSAQPRLEEAGLEERALNSRESRLDPPQDSKAPWNRSSILRRSSSSSIASSSRGLRCWSTCAEEIRVWKKKDKTDLRLIIFLVVNGGPAVGLNDGGEAGEAAGSWGRGTGVASE